MPRSSSPVGTANKASEATTPASLTAPILALNMTTCPSLSPVTHDKPSRGTRTNKGQPKTPNAPRPAPIRKARGAQPGSRFAQPLKTTHAVNCDLLFVKKVGGPPFFIRPSGPSTGLFFSAVCRAPKLGVWFKRGWLGTKKKILLERKESYVGSCSRYASLVLVF